MWEGGQGRCVRRSEVFVKIQNNFLGGVGGGRGRVGGVFRVGDGEGGRGVRVDVNEELKFL